MLKIHNSKKGLIASLSMVFAMSSASFGENYEIKLTKSDGSGVHVGNLETKAQGEGWSYKIAWEKSAFEEHFLSMRPFKCVPIDDKLWCHAPYPYEIRREIKDDDLVDLEYDLIFVWKPEGEYGIDLWNGVYYQLSQTDFGWRGEMHEYDLNVLGIPPDEGELRPIEPSDLHDADVDDHPFPFVEIRLVE